MTRRIGRRKDIHYAIRKGANDWDASLRGACRGRRRSIIELMIAKGANPRLSSGYYRVY